MAPHQTGRQRPAAQPQLGRRPALGVLTVKYGKGGAVQVVADQAEAQVLALRAAVGPLDPGRDDARAAEWDDVLGRQPVQAGAAAWASWRRAGPSYRAPLRHGRNRKLPRLGGLRAHPSCGHGRAVSWPVTVAKRCCHDGRERLPRMDVSGTSAQRTATGTDGPGLACPLPRITLEVRRRQR